MSMQKQDSVVLEARSPQRHEPEEGAACGSACHLVLASKGHTAQCVPVVGHTDPRRTRVSAADGSV